MYLCILIPYTLHEVEYVYWVLQYLTKFSTIKIGFYLTGLILELKSKQ